MAIAARIAAVTQLANRSAIWTGLDEGLQPEDVPLESLVGGSEREPLREGAVDLTAIRESLGTGLFSSRGLSRQGWQHQTYAEYLAAFRLNAHGLPPERLRSLLLHPDGSGKVIPQLRELAVWLAEMNLEVFQMLVRTDPEILLRSDLAVARSADRATLAKQLLNTFESGGITDSVWDIRQDFARLNNPELASIVRPYLSSPSRPWEARVAAIEIARACRLTDLQVDLVAIALDPQETTRVRVRAASAIADVGEPNARAALRPLALGLAGDDSEDELKGCALMATWPTHIISQELFSALAPMKDSHHLGAYYRFLDSGIAAHLRPADLVIAINWARQHAGGRDPFDRLPKLALDILERAADQIDQPQVLELVATALFALQREHTNCDRITAKLCARGDDARRAVARCMLSVAAADPHGAFAIMRVCALGAHDITWLLAELSNVSADDARRIIAKMISLALDPRDVDTFGAVLTAASSSQDLWAAIGPLIAPTLLGTPEAAQIKAEHEQFMADRRPNVVSPPVPVTERLSKILASSNPETFFRVYWLFHNDGPDAGTRADPLPGWSGFDEGIKARILGVACDYLRAKPPVPEGVWWKEGRFTAGMLAGSSALHLLAIHSPASLDLLTSSDWNFWTKIILTDWVGESEASCRSVLLAKAYQNAMSTFLSTFNDIIEAEDEQHKQVFVISRIGELWNEELADILRSKITGGALNPSSFKTILAKMLSMADCEAKTLAQAAATGTVPSDGDDRRRAVYATVELISNDPGEWETVWPLLQVNESFGVEVLQIVAYEHEHNSFAIALEEHQIADICIWLSKLGLEKVEDDPHEPGLVTPPVALAHWWNTLINFLTYKGTTGACDAIRRLIEALPQYDGLKMSLRRAEDRMRRTTWVP